MTPQEKAEMLLYDFYLRSQAEEQAIYEKGKKFAYASDRILESQFHKGETISNLVTMVAKVQPITSGEWFRFLHPEELEEFDHGQYLERDLGEL